jgi:hypothetical protein
MPWKRRVSRERRPLARLRRDLRRWRYDNSEGLRSFWIGAAVATATLVALAALRLLG